MIQIGLVSIISSESYGNSGIEYIAYELRKNKEVCVNCLYYHNGESIEKIMSDIGSNYDIIGFSVYPTNYKQYISIANQLKQRSSKIVTIMGGGFVTLNWKDIVDDMSSIDYLIIGEGEEPFHSLVKYYLKNNNLVDFEHSSIVSKTSRVNKIVCKNQDVERWCSFDYYENFSKEENKRKIHCLFTKTNVCTGACSFCCSLKGKVIYKTIDRIVDEIEYVSNKFGIRHFYFSDDNIFDIDSEETKSRLIELFKRIKGLNKNLVFSAFAKCNSIKRENIELYKLMSEIGFYFIFLGVDAGNEADRRLYNKASLLSENIESIRILSEVGIWVPMV